MVCNVRRSMTRRIAESVNVRQSGSQHKYIMTLCAGDKVEERSCPSYTTRWTKQHNILLPIFYCLTCQLNSDIITNYVNDSHHYIVSCIIYTIGENIKSVHIIVHAQI